MVKTLRLQAKFSYDRVRDPEPPPSPQEDGFFHAISGVKPVVRKDVESDGPIMGVKKIFLFSYFYPVRNNAPLEFLTGFSLDKL